MTFSKAIQNTPVATTTTNGMAALESTTNPLVDLFFQSGASRGKDIIPLFERAFQHDPHLTARIALWLRDARGGAGERQLFRDILRHMEQNMPHKIMLHGIVPKVPELGRWDDLLVFETEEAQHIAYTFIEHALKVEKNGLCAKWMPRKGPKAIELRGFMGLAPKEYRQLLVGLSQVVETKMCAKKWDEINFEHVPSLAASRYQKAFVRNAAEAYGKFKERLVKGEAKVNASAVYPYDIIKSLRHGGDKVVSLAQWEALPNYVGDAKILPVVDVSGSMTCSAGGSKTVSCLDVAVSLGLYLADKNKGAFKDVFMTFSTDPKLEVLKGNLISKMTQMEKAHWSMSTNIEKAFQAILSLAKNANVDAADMPQYICIMSDMQFNCVQDPSKKAIDMIRQQYEEAGYVVPKVVFWNLHAHNNVPVKFTEQDTALISGFSPAIMKSVLSAESFTPESIMLKTISDPRYNLHI